MAYEKLLPVVLDRDYDYLGDSAKFMTLIGFSKYETASEFLRFGDNVFRDIILLSTLQS